MVLSYKIWRSGEPNKQVIPVGNYRMTFQLPAMGDVKQQRIVLDRKVAGITLQNVLIRPQANEAVLYFHVDNPIPLETAVVSGQGVRTVTGLLGVKSVDRIILPNWAIVVILLLIAWQFGVVGKLLHKLKIA